MLSCDNCDFLWNEHLTAFGQYKHGVMQLNRGIHVAAVDEDSENDRVITESRLACDAVLAELLAHLRAHETSLQN